jgi:hypothetical protein
MNCKNNQPSTTGLNARYLIELTRLRTQAERQGKPAIVNAFSALIERKQAEGNNRICRPL